MSAPKIRTQSTFKSTLLIDDVAIDVRVKRMTNTEFDAFADGFAKWSDPRGPEETPEARAQREQESAVWMREALDAYLSIIPGEIEHDAREITKGGELLDIYGGRMDVVPQAIALIYGENRVSEKKKETYRSRLASRFGSTNEPPPTGNGDRADLTAAAADVPASIGDAGATAPPSAASSGTTDPSV
ncbi:MAG TPA: hypothetical protein VNR64_07635 [Vicinamibacterales bacterium]|nr:hypothetical protein [Vicinamibacterales bacterium]